MSQTILIEEIQKLIPHRYPMLLVDRMEEVELGTRCVGIKNVSMNEWFFVGHFPDHPIMPGVLIVEALAQTAGALVIKSEEALQHEGRVVYFMSIDDVKFRKPVVPGDTLKLKVEKIQNRGAVWKFKGEAYVDDRLATEAVFTAMVSKKDK